MVELDFESSTFFTLHRIALMAVLSLEGKFASHTASKGLAIYSPWEMFWNKYSFKIVFSEINFRLKEQQIEA